MKKNNGGSCFRKILSHVNLVGVIFAALFLISAAALAASAASGTLSEGLWKEFVENKPDEAKIIYKQIIESYKDKSQDKQLSEKAKQRLDAIDEKKATVEIEVSEKPQFILSVNMGDIIYKLLPDEQIRGDIWENIKLLLSDFVKENTLEMRVLPLVKIVNFSGALTPEETDVIITFSSDATFKKNENAAKGLLGNYIGYNLDWNVILFTCQKNETEIIERYKKHGIKPESLKMLTKAIDEYIKTSDKPASNNESVQINGMFYLYFENISKFISDNKIGKDSNLSENIKKMILTCDGYRFYLLTGCDKENIDIFVGFLERLSGLSLLPVSPLKDEFYGYKIKLGGVDFFSEKAEKMARLFNENFSGAREVAKYKACIANIRNITSAFDLYLMQNKIERNNLKGLSLEKLVSEKYLTSVPQCQQGGKYSYAEHKDGGEFECSVHGSSTKIIEFKLIKIDNGKEKVLSQPKIKTLVYNNSTVTVGSEEKNEKVQQDSLKFLKIVVKLSKDNETADKKIMIAGMNINYGYININGSESMRNYNIKMKVPENSEEWILINDPQKRDQNLKIYFRVK